MAKDAELIVFQLYHRVVVAYPFSLFYQLRCVVRLNEEHDFSLTSLTIEVSVAKRFHFQLLIRKFYIHVAFMCKWQSINIDDVWMDISRNLVTPMLAEQRHSGDRDVAWSVCSCQCVNSCEEQSVAV